MDGRYEIDNKIDDKINAILKNMPDYVSEWNIQMKNNRCTATTRLNYVKKIRNFLKTINTDIVKVDVKEINASSVRRYFSTIDERRKEEYRQTIWSTIHNFLGFLYREHLIDENYIERTQRPRSLDPKGELIKRYKFTEKDFNKILAVVKRGMNRSRNTCTGSSSNSRDYAIFILFMTTGMRRTALTEINISDIDFENNKLPVMDKRRKTHIYELSDIAIKSIKNWIDDRKTFSNHIDTDALFINKYGKRISSQSIYEIVEKYTKEALGEGVSPHKLRAGFCTILYKKTGDLQFVCDAVGHSSTETTKRYVVKEDDSKKKSMAIMSSIISS